MLDLALTERSPFAALAHGPATIGPQPGGVTLIEATPAAMVALSTRRGGADALARSFAAGFGFELPAGPGRRSSGLTSAVWAQPDQWLVLGEAGLEQRLAASLGGVANLIDVTGGRAVIGVRGPRAESALQKLFPIDLDPKVFGLDAAATTVGAYLTVQVWRLGLDAFELAVGRSFAVSLWRALVHAGEEYGIAQVFAGPSTRRPSAGGSG